MENNNKTFKHIETLGQIAERVRLDVAMIAHRLETLQRNLNNAPSPCDGRAVAEVVGDFVTDLREAIAPLRWETGSIFHIVAGQSRTTEWPKITRLKAKNPLDLCRGPAPAAICFVKA